MSIEKYPFFKIIDFDTTFRSNLNYTNLGQGPQTAEKTIVEADPYHDQRIYGIDVFTSDKYNKVLLLSIWDGVSNNVLRIGSIIISTYPNSRLIGAIDIPAFAGVKDSIIFTSNQVDSVCLAKSPEFITYFNRKDEMGKSYMCIPKGYSLRVALTGNRFSNGGTSFPDHPRGTFNVVVTGDIIGTGISFAPLIDLPSGGTASGGTASGGTASGGTASGGTASGGTASGGTASGGTASGGTSVTPDIPPSWPDGISE
jgi:hypothetical protein